MLDFPAICNTFSCPFREDWGAAIANTSSQLVNVSLQSLSGNMTLNSSMNSGVAEVDYYVDPTTEFWQ